MTRFQILARWSDRANAGWLEHSLQDAHSAEAAVKAAYMKAPNSDVVAMVAVPERSWRPTPIRTETTTRVVLGEAAREDAPKDAP